ncbi:hypothetical protein EI427_17755 [Flammeovirga pectinis]|uniref:Peptidase S74 domain-containing protein n=1 Tax=Flammeovirga pectinis TaxID=2494373 RepID=A0A3Q9FT44_9BACT|nr:tail fiber domain-containing protein [Flammeovirga pectinis]AZQ64003.1 hypothetical protein EI427_17755 [Flammeovirga pectinis]
MKLIYSVLILAFFALSLHAQKIPFQGKLTENGTALTTTKNITFSMSNWTETHENVQITDGFYAVVLGSITPIEGNIYNEAGEAILSVEIEGVQLDDITLYAPIVKPQMMSSEIKLNHPNDSLGALVNANNVNLYSEDGRKKVALDINQYGGGGLSVYDSAGANKAWLFPYGNGEHTGGMLSLYGDNGAWVGTGFRTWEANGLPFFHLEGYDVEHKPLVELQVNEVHDNTGSKISESGSLKLQSSADSQAGFDLGVKPNNNGDQFAAEMFLWGHNTPNFQFAGQSWDNINRPMLQLFGETSDGGGWYKTMANLSVSYEYGKTAEYGDLLLSAGNDDNQKTQVTAFGLWHSGANGSGINLYEKNWDNDLPIFELSQTSTATWPILQVQINKDWEGTEYPSIDLHNINADLFTQFTHDHLEFRDTLNTKININKDVIDFNSSNGSATFSKEHIIFNTPNGEMAKMSTVNENGTDRGEVILWDQNGGELILNTSTDFSAISSDRRYKSSITPLQNSLEKVMLLKGVSYFYRADKFPKKSFDTDLQIGLIAQEVEEVLPELVKTDKDGYKAVHYAQTVAVLIEAIKELNQKVDALTVENTSLKANLETAQANAAQIKVLQTQMLQLLSEVQSK